MSQQSLLEREWSPLSFALVMTALVTLGYCLAASPALHEAREVKPSVVPTATPTTTPAAPPQAQALASR